MLLQYVSWLIKKFFLDVIFQYVLLLLLLYRF